MFPFDRSAAEYGGRAAGPGGNGAVGVELRRARPLPRAARGGARRLVRRGRWSTSAPTSGGSCVDEAKHGGRRARDGCSPISTPVPWSAHPVPLARAIIDLEPIDARRAGGRRGSIARSPSACARCRDGVGDKIVRLRVRQRAASHRARARSRRDPGPQGLARCTSTSISVAPRSTGRSESGAPGTPSDPARSGATLSAATAAPRRARPRGASSISGEALMDSVERELARGLMQINRLRLVQLPPAREHRARAGRRAHRDHRPQRGGEDHPARGDRLGDVRDAGRPRQPRDDPPPRRTAARRGSRWSSSSRSARTHYRIVRTLNGAELYQDGDPGADREQHRCGDRARHPPPRDDAGGVLQYLLHRAEGAGRHGGHDAPRSGPSSSPACSATSGSARRRSGSRSGAPRCVPATRHCAGASPIWASSRVRKCGRANGSPRRRRPRRRRPRRQPRRNVGSRRCVPGGSSSSACGRPRSRWRPSSG